MKQIKLKNGVDIPIEGYGVFQIDPEETEQCIIDSLDVGYRSLDTAATYGNEEGVAKPFKKVMYPVKNCF